MDYVEKILHRANLQQLREFLINGTEFREPDPRSYRERLEDAETKVLEGLSQCSMEASQQEAMANLIYRYGSVCEEVYLEVGMQAGANLIRELCPGGGNLFKDYTRFK